MQMFGYVIKLSVSVVAMYLEFGFNDPFDLVWSECLGKICTSLWLWFGMVWVCGSIGDQPGIVEGCVRHASGRHWHSL